MSLPFVSPASAGTDTDTDGGGGTTSTSVQQQINTTTSTTRPGGSNLARTGGDWAVPATVAAGGVAIAMGARRLARRPTL